jgi:hypothetical protein
MQKHSGSIVRLGLSALGMALMIAVAGDFNEAGAQTKKKSTSTKTAKPAPKKTTVPVGTEMTIRLENEIDSKKAKDGDKFTAIVISPEKYADATIEGHVAKIKQSGKIKGTTDLSLAFDSITLNDTGEKIPIAAQLVEVSDGKSKKKVDEEGNVQSGSQGKETAVRAGGGAALGAIIGGIAGGGAGAAIGAGVGAGAGAGSTLITGSKKIKLESGTEILIKTTR